MSARETGFLEAAGQRLEVARFGPREAPGPTLVLLHQGLGCVAMWRDYPARLAQASGLETLVYSRLGYGRSAPLTGPREVRFMHDEGLEVLPALLEAAGVDDFILVGHSDGASIAIIYAGGVGHPGLRGLVLEAPHVFIEEICIASVAAIAERFRTTDMARGFARYHGDNTEGAFWGWARAWLRPEFRHWNIEQYLAPIRVPVLAIQGEDDEYGTMAQVDAIAAQVSGPHQCLKLPDCGHEPHREQEAAVLDATTAFIRERMLQPQVVT